MEHNPVTAGSEPVQSHQAASLHEAAWPDMLTNLHVAYAELTHTQLELERRMGEIDEARELFERVVESMTEALFLMDVTGRIIRVNRAARELLDRDEAALLGAPFAEICATTAIPATPGSSWHMLQVVYSLT